MAIKGGARPGAGRKPGVPNRRTQENIAKAEASGLMPLEYMLAIMRNEAMTPESRFEAAKAAAPYVHAKLSSTEIKGPNDGPVQVQAVEWQIVPAKPEGS